MKETIPMRRKILDQNVSSSIVMFTLISNALKICIYNFSDYNIVNGKYVCKFPECGQKFRIESEVKEHLRVLHKTEWCRNCDRFYSRKYFPKHLKICGVPSARVLGKCFPHISNNNVVAADSNYYFFCRWETL